MAQTSDDGFSSDRFGIHTPLSFRSPRRSSGQRCGLSEGASPHSWTVYMYTLVEV